MIKQKFSKIRKFIKRYGLRKTVKKIILHIFKTKRKKEKLAEKLYQDWILQNEPKEEELKSQKVHEFEWSPKISIIVPMYHTNENYFLELLNSLFAQTYTNWELCLADGSEQKNETIFAMCSRCSKIKYQFLSENKGISENTNQALEMADGDFIAFLDHDDCLPPFALYEVVKTIQENPEVEFIYSDEDKINEKGERFQPYFKPDFSPETLECHNYITHLVVLKKTLLDKIGKLDSRLDGAQDFDFVLRATENTKNIVHIPKILYHWRAHKNSTAKVSDAKNYAYEAGAQAVAEHLKRMGKEAIVKKSDEVPGMYQVKYKVNGNPRVDILIYNINHASLLKKCLKSILMLTTYKNYEVSTLDKPFDQNNRNGDFILLLDSHTKILTPEWLELLIGYAQNKEIGAVGARLYARDKSIKQVENDIPITENVKNLMDCLADDVRGYFNQNVATRNVKKLSNACLLVRREIFEEIGWQDVDFCSKILEKGYRIVYNPYVELLHYEKCK